MDMTWINVVDTAVKIGFGALITAIASYVSLRKSHSHEDKKEAKEYFYKRQEERKTKYVELLIQSQELIQRYLYSSCTYNSDDYINYLRTFNEVQIISSNGTREVACKLVNEVQMFIHLNKNKQEQNLMNEMVASARKMVALFQSIAHDDITRCYKYE